METKYFLYGIPVIGIEYRPTDCIVKTFKGKLGEFQIYFRKIPLYQLKFLVVSVLSNSLWLPRNLKNVQNETTKLFSVGNTFNRCFYSKGASIGFFVSVAR